MTVVTRSLFLFLLLFSTYSYSQVVYTTNAASGRFSSFSEAKGAVQSAVDNNQYYDFVEFINCPEMTGSTRYITCSYSQSYIHDNFSTNKSKEISRHCRDSSDNYVSYSLTKPECSSEPSCDPDQFSPIFKVHKYPDGSMTDEQELEQYKIRAYCDKDEASPSNGCGMEQIEQGLLTPSSTGSGVEYMATYKVTGTCESNLPEEEPEDLAGNDYEISNTGEISKDGFTFDPKQTNCGTVNGKEICLPLVESNQTDSLGKDLLTQPSDQPKPEGIDLIGQIIDGLTGEGMSIFNAPANNSKAVQGKFDNGEGSYSVLTTPGDGTGGGSASGGSAGSDTGTTNDLLKGIGDDIKGDETTLPTKGSYNTSTLQGEIDALKAQISAYSGTIKVEGAALFSNNQTGSGSLYCNKNIPIFGGSTFDICFDDYRDQLSIIGTFIIAISLILSVYIVLKG